MSQKPTPAPNSVPPSLDASVRNYEYNQYWSSLIFGRDFPIMGQGPHVQVSLTESYYLILVCVKQWNQRANWRKRFELGSCISDSIGKILQCSLYENSFLRLDDGRYFVILRSSTFRNQAELLQSCERLATEISMDIGPEICCYVCPPVAIDALSNMADKLMKLDEDNVDGRSLIVLEDETIPQNPMVLPDMKQWLHYMSDQKFDQLLIEVDNYLTQLLHHRSMSRSTLLQFIQDFNQMLYVSLQEKSIPARRIFATEQGIDLLRNASNSIADTLNWCFWAVTQFSIHIEQKEKGMSYVEQAKDYIQEHLTQEFTRQDIADKVHLSQNHLARLFKKEMGMSISEYILRERMNIAYDLLANTDLPLNEVAFRVGYENYSYFLNLFRRITGMRPSEYRSHSKSQKGESK